MKGITLIGMPTSGKSTVCNLLAKKLGWPVYDIDRLIEEKEGIPIAKVIKQKGRDYVIKLEAESVLELNLENTILAPGGSIIYGKNCHGHISRQSRVIWLDVPIEAIQERLADDPNNERGIIGLEDSGLMKLFVERVPKYKALADIKVETADKTPEVVAQEILEKVN